jgi:NADPH:quinone reductase-like Zn-dependent oxidoreductase
MAKSLSFSEASTLPCAGVTAWNALFCGIRPLHAGGTVVTIGTGGVSVLAAQLAIAAGARVVSVSSSDEKLARIQAFGSSHTVNRKQHPEWGARIAELTQAGVTHVVEVGGLGTLAQSMQAVGFGGEISLIGVLSREGDANPMALMVKGASLRGIFVGSAEMARDLNAFIDHHQIKPVVDRTFSFEQALDAYAYQASGDLYGKVVIADS